MEKSIQIATFARRLRYAVMGFGALLAAATFASIVLPPMRGHGGAVLDSDGLPHAWAAWIAVASVGFMLVGLIELCRMLRLVEADAAFSRHATRHLKHFGALLITAVLVAIIVPGLVRMALQGSLILSLDSSDALLLLVSVLIFLIARLLDAAARYQEDSRSIV